MKQYNGVYGYNQSHMLWCNSNFVVLKPEKFGFFTLDLPCSFYERNIGNEFHNYIFLPFALPFSWFIDISNSIPPAFWTFVICSGLMISIKLRKTKNLPSSQFHLTILLTISSIFFIFFSNMIYLYRFDKEYQQVAPFISVLTSICMNIIYQFTKAGLRKMVSEKKLSS